MDFLYSNDTGGELRFNHDAGEVTVHVQHCRMSPRSRPADHILVILMLAVLYRLGIRSPARSNPWLSALLKADVIGDIRGGDSFSDIYGLRRFIVGCLPLLSVALLGRPFVLLPQTYGPYRSAVARAVARWFLVRATKVITRDRRCIRQVEILCNRRPDFCPDVAFTLQAVPPRSLGLQPKGRMWDSDIPRVGVNVSGLLYSGGYTGRNMFGLKDDYAHTVKALVRYLLENTEATILIVPHEFGAEGEEEACKAVFDHVATDFAGRLFAVTAALTERELKHVIGGTDLFVGSRMHACIAAISQGVPAVALAYSDKFLGVFDSVGLAESVIDLRTTSAPAVCEMAAAALRRRHEAKDELLRFATEVRTEVHSTFGQLLGP